MVCMRGVVATLALLGWVSGWLQAGEVRGRIEMPAACSPGVSPAVVMLEPETGGTAEPALASGSVRLVVNQKHLQFQPRVTASSTGGTITFTNADQEPHNVRAVGPGLQLSRTIAPGEQFEMRVQRPGVVRLLCDIHIHMRGFVVVGETPWIRTCDREGRFRLSGVPAGRYRLKVWHELGQPLVRDLEVGETALELGTLAVEGNVASPGVASSREVLAWADVIDRVSVACASALDRASRKSADTRGLAETLVDDAYFVHFEGSDMETAVRAVLGFTRAAEIERAFRTLRKHVRGLEQGEVKATEAANALRGLLAMLVAAARELDSQGVTDRGKVLVTSVNTRSSDGVDEEFSGESAADVAALERAFARVLELANAGEPRAAAAEMVTAYFEAFEPIEQVLLRRDPGSVRPLESRFATLRGEISGGLSGAQLADALGRLSGDVSEKLKGFATGRDSSFHFGFVASLGTIVREGLEVILVLTMLTTLITKAGRPRGASAALWWGVAAAVVASGLTAIGLNQLVSSARGQARELIEGVVMLVASGVLFYVSYWLISQSETQRWLSFLKDKAREGAAGRGFLTLGLVAFLAVFREGAETVLMYQALLVNQTASGLLGVAAGVLVGIVILAIMAAILRWTSLKLPLGLFFKATGVLLFVLAVVFAGNGVLELQVAGVLRSNPLDWLGGGLPLLGLHPTVQGLSVQGLMIVGAVLAFLVLNRRPRPGVLATSGLPHAGESTAATSQVKPLATVSHAGH